MTNTPLNPITAATCVIRATDARPGRTLSVSPGLTASRNLHYGRIRLGASDSQVRVNPGGLETGLISLKGEARVSVAGTDYTMRPYDALYVPREMPFTVAPGAAGCDLAEIAAPVDKTYPLRFVAFADVERDPGLSFQSGGPTSQRRINILLGKNVEAGRIVVGVTFSEPGHWTSWPPHEHADLLEEAYLYVGMPAPSFGVQLVYTNPGEPELATIVHEGDVVLMPKGYHPNVAAPGCSIGFIWMMAANREGVDRLFGVVNVQPEFAGGGSGLEKGRADAPTDKAGR
jgi:5-deoxy-glucuronate isomerase